MTKKNRGGRRSKLTNTAIDVIAKGVRFGLTYEQAANAAGVSAATFYNWKKKAEDGDPRFLEFLEALKQAEGEGEYLLAATIAQAAQLDPSQWRAAAFILERRFPERWGRVTRLEAAMLETGAIDMYRAQVVELIQNGELIYKDAIKELGVNLAKELFAAAGVEVAGIR